MTPWQPYSSSSWMAAPTRNCDQLPKRQVDAKFALMSKAFREIKTGLLPDGKASGTLYKHVAKGMEVFHVEADDSESCFAYSFKTLPFDSTGVFHIIEHTVLSGSAKYPVKDPFTLLDAHSCNSYMNALTFPDRTVYPGASPVLKDFWNIFRLYTDSVFAPLLRRSSFETEGIRLGDGSFEGVVFNEMRGDRIQDEALAAAWSRRGLYPGTAYGMSSGGDVHEMALLSYEAYKETWKRFYCPANCRLMVYGKDIDIDQVLDFLEDAYLSKLEAGNEAPSVPPTARWPGERHVTVPCQGLTPDAKGDFLVSFLTHGRAWDPYDNLFSSVLVDALLGGASNPLYKALLDCGLGDDVSEQCGMSGDFNEIPFTVGMSGVAEEDLDKLRSFIMDSLSKLARDGIGEDVIEASIRRQEFLLQEVSGGMPRGFRIFMKCIRAWDRGGDIWAALDTGDAIRRLREGLSANPRLFEDWIQEELIDNPHRLCLHVRPEEDLVTKEEEELRRLYKERLEKLPPVPCGDEEWLEDTASLFERLTIDDVDKECDQLQQEEVFPGLLYDEEDSGDVCYLTLVGDLSDQGPEEQLAALVLSRYALMAGREGEDASLFHRALRLSSGGYYAYIETGRASDDEVKIMYTLRIKCLSRDVEDCLGLMRDWIVRLDRHDTAACQNAIADLIGDYEAYVEESGSSFASSLACAPLSPSLSLGEDLMGITAWKRLCGTALGEMLGGISHVLDRLLDRERLTLQLASSKSFKEEGLALCKAFLESFEEGGGCAGGWSHPLTHEAGTHVYRLPSSLAYNAAALPTSKWPSIEQEAEAIFLQVLSTGTLWNELRVIGGAYGADASLDTMEEVMVLMSYRDPHLASSFDAMRRAVLDCKPSPGEVEDAKLGRMGRMLKPQRPSQRSVTALRRTMYKISDEMRAERRRCLRELDHASVMAARERILSALPNASYASLSGPALVSQELPEGAVVEELPS